MDNRNTMKTLNLDPVKLKNKGYKALYKTLGAVGTIRFLQLIEIGKGNYTKERTKWLKNYKIEDVIREIKKLRIK